MLKLFFFAVGALILVGCLYYGVRFYILLQHSKTLVQNAIPYSRDAGPGFSMLVIGDSTAVGVGAANPEESLPGRVAQKLTATYVENHAVSGAMVENLPQQISQVKRQSYDLILVQIGGNDITHLHSATKTAEALAATLRTLPAAKQVLVVSVGDVGSATIFPSLLRPLFTLRTWAYHAAFEKAVSAEGATYVNLYTAPRNYLFKKEPGVYFAADGFHPSSAGYAIWFEAVAPHLIH